MAEIVDFFWSNEEDKIIYVTNVFGNSEEHVTNFLYNAFNAFGCVHELVIFNSSFNNTNEEPLDASNCKVACGEEAFYALVKFYSKKSARLAIQSQLELNGHKIKLVYSKKKNPHPPRLLYYKKCFELAQYYLGFNGWSLKILNMTEIKEPWEEDLLVISFECVVVLDIKQGPVRSKGVGRASDSYSKDAPTMKSQIYPKVRKNAYKVAVENAFSHILLVVLDNGKVHVEVTEDDQIYKRDDDEGGTLTVNEISEYPLSDAEEDLLMAAED